MKRYISVFLIVITIVAGISLGALGGEKSGKPGAGKSADKAGAPAKGAAPAAAQMPPTTVLVGKAVPRKPILQRKYVGTFEPIEKFVTLARVSGNIEEQPFKEGDLVQKGAVLFEIEKIRYQATLDAAKARIESSKAKIESIKAQLQQTESRLRYAQNNYDRNKKLYDQGSVVSKDAMENAKSILDGQTAEHKSIQAQQLMAEADLQAALADIKITEDDLSHCTIFSEITGRAGRVNHTVGNYITPASGAMVTIVQMDPIYFRFSMSERDFVSMFGNAENLKNTASITIELANGEKYTEEGHISFVDNQLRPSTNTIYIWSTFQNSKEILRPGGVATVALSKPEEGLKPAVKVSALMFDGVSHSVYIVNAKNEIEKRTVTLGPTDAGWQIIDSGVNVGETVVIDGTHKIMLRPGMPFVVNPVFEQTNSAAQPGAPRANTQPSLSLSPNKSNGGAK